VAAPLTFDHDEALGRFWAKVEVCPVTGCWHWRGAISHGGQRTVSERRRQLPYGSFRVGRRLVLRAHIFVAWAFGLIEGPRVPPGHEIDHECENSLCVCPWHISCVPRGVNQDYRHGRRDRRRPTWAELYALRGVGTDEDAAEPRHI